MATSQYSILRQYTPYVSPYNLDLIKDVMVYKQGQVDANRAKINQQVDYLMGQQIAKPEAREYMENRMADTLARVNEMYRGADLSSEGITRHIQSEISSVLDSTVINAIAGTKEGQHMQDRLNEMAINGDKAYSDMNAYVAMKPYYEWLNDGKAGSRLQPLHYTPYTDYNAEVQGAMKTIQQAALKGHKYSFPLYGDDNQPTGAMIEYTNSSITPQQAAAYAAASISPNARQQMQIEAIYMADMQPDQFSYGAYQNYLSSQVSEVQNYINSLEAKKMGVAGNEQRRQEIQSEINRSKGVLVELKNAMEVPMSQYSPYEAAAMVVNRNFLNSAAQKYSFDNSSTEIKEDPIYWNKQKLDIQIATLNQRKAEAEALNKYRQESLRLKQEDLDIKRQNAGVSSPGGTGLPSDRIPTTSTVVAPTTQQLQNVNFKKDNKERYLELTMSRKEATNTFLNNLTPEQKTQLGAEILNLTSSENTGYTGMTMEDALVKYISENGGLQNDVFIYKDRDDKERTKKLKDSYIKMRNLSMRIGNENRYISRENEVRKGSVDEVWTDLKYRFNTSSTPKAQEIANTAIPLIAESIYRNGGEGGFKNATSDFISAIGDDLNEIQRKIDEETGNQSHGFNIWDYFTYDNNSGNYVIADYENAPDVIKFMKRAFIDRDGGNYLKTYHDIVHSYYPEDTKEDSINAIEQERYQQLVRNRIYYPSDMTNRDPEYGTMNTLRNLFMAHRNANPVRDTGAPASIDGYELEHLGGDRYRINAMFNGANQASAEVSAQELTQNGVNIGDSNFNIPVEGYDSGEVRVSFSDENNTQYIRLVESEMGDSAYATKSGAATILSSNIDTAFRLAGSKIDYDASSELKRQIGIITQTLLDNAEKFKIRYIGFGTNTDYVTGYDTQVLLANQNNEAGPSEEVAAYSTKGIQYMDTEDDMLIKMPQVAYIEVLQEGIKKELEYLASKGYTMDDITRLTNEGRPVFNPSGILMRMYVKVRGGNDNA